MGIDPNWQEPSEKAAKEIGESVTEFAKQLEISGPASAYDANDRVELTEGAKLPRAGGRVRSLEGKTGRVVGMSFIAKDGSPHRGEVCRGVELDDGTLVTTPECHIRTGRVLVGFSGMSQERWDQIFGSRRK